MLKLNQLVAEFQKIFNHKRIIVPAEKVINLMLSYQSDKNDWEELVLYNRKRYSQRLLNPKPLEIYKLLLCCYLPVLKGTIKEQRYVVMNEDANLKSKLIPEDQSFATLNQCLHIQGVDKFHNLMNPDDKKTTVTLQIYWKPYTQYLAYDENKGHLVTKHTPFKFSGKHKEGYDS